MLTSLLIRNLALIEELEIDFSPGFNTVTGETGAGKSVIIGAVQLLLGQRADRSAIRGGADACEVNGIFDLSAEPELLAAVDAVLEEAGVPACEDGQLLLRRWFSEKSARVHVNSTPVTLSVLRQLGDLLVDVHGPYDHQSLLKPARQLAVLDAFGGYGDDLDTCRQLHDKLRQARDKLAESDREHASPELVELLRHQVKEIDKAKLREGELQELTQRHATVANASEILELVGHCYTLLHDSDNAILDQVADITRHLQDLEHLDSEAGRQFVQLIENAFHELETLATELNDYGDQVDIDPQEFIELEDRLAVLQRLKRKYGGSMESVFSFHADAMQRLERLDDLDAYRERLQQDVDKAEADLAEAARKLSRKRREQARKLAPQITDKLRRLGFPDGEFDIEVAEAPLGARGADSVEFYVAPNPGEGRQPLRAIASSGEISRIMLALKTVLAAADDVPLLIFDEVDANVGGVVAVTVGQELRRLGQERQVICITHLPQVAAGGDRHFRVAKQVRQKRTIAEMIVLDEDARVDELARMLGGDSASSVVRTHAQELIAKANAN